ncbi:MAG: hypothetical protein ACRBK7_24455 [Acidimicrobiales bacterium]
MVGVGASTIPTGSSLARLAARVVDSKLWLLAFLVRLAAVVVLVGGPWTDEAAELSGWDAERFQEIAERDGAAWVDQPIEYPPGSVVVLDLLAGEDVVSTNRRLIVVSALLELVGVAIIWRRFGPRTGKAFLLLGLPLVPMGLMRLDMMVTVIAALAAAALLSSRRSLPESEVEQATGESRQVEPSSATGLAPLIVFLPLLGFSLLSATGAMIKIWPALLVAGAIGIGRRHAAAAAAAVTAAFGLAWLAVTGDGLEPLDQILSLRGATGWHVESLPGSIVALFTSLEPRLELNAFRIGTLNRSVVTIARVAAVAMIVTLALRAAKQKSAGEVERLALVMLGSVSALLVTAPLLSPQFLLWLTPWAALLVGLERAPRMPIILTVAALVLTGFTLTVFGPQRLGQPLPALLLLIRNLTLVALPFSCLLQLRAKAYASWNTEGKTL